LTACGGTVSGLGAGVALTLSLGSEKLTVGANGNFAFPTRIENGAPYSVSVSAPAGTTCRVSEAAGVIGGADVGKVAIACAPVVLAGVVNPMQVPLSVTGDGAGNLYVVDSAAASVLKISTAAGADGNAIVLELPNTGDLVQVVQVTPAGQTSVLVTLAHVQALLKNPAAGFAPEGMATDAAGNLYISDRATALIYKRTKSGELSVFAGTALKDTGDVDGPPGTATLGFYGYSFLAADDKGNVYASGHGKLRMISPAGVVSTPNLGWGDVAVGPIAYAKGKLYGLTRYAVVQTWLP